MQFNVPDRIGYLWEIHLVAHRKWVMFICRIVPRRMVYVCTSPWEGIKVAKGLFGPIVAPSVVSWIKNTLTFRR
jgi:hypothetical protein